MGKGGNQWPELILVVAMMKTMTVARNNVMMVMVVIHDEN